METSEILKKVRKIEIKTKGLSQNIFAGQYILPLRVGVWRLPRFASISLAMTFAT